MERRKDPNTSDLGIDETGSCAGVGSHSAWDRPQCSRLKHEEISSQQLEIAQIWAAAGCYAYTSSSKWTVRLLGCSQPSSLPILLSCGL